jgi:arylsulfatase
MTRRHGLAAWTVAVLALGLGACSRSPRPSIVLITIDTLRPDHLGCYGYARPTTPRIDALARQSMVFDRAYTTLPRTTQGVASILTGRYPKSHGARGLFSRLPATNLTLAEALRDSGYATAAIVSNTFLRPGQGFEQGFDTYENPETRWDADSAGAVTASAVRWLDAGRDRRPFFLWVHYLDPHWRYEPPSPWDTRFDPGFDGPFTLYADLDARRFTKGQVIFGGGLAPRVAEHVIALYDGEIGATDAAVGTLIDRLEQVRGPLLVVLTSDHGESLGEHGYHFAHGEYLYEEGLRVPLLVRYPGAVAAGGRSAGLVENIDIAPTILALAGVSRMQGVEGRPILIPAASPGGPQSGGQGGSPDGSPRDVPGGARFVAAPGRPFNHAESDFELIHPENPRYYIPGPLGRWNSASDGRYKLIHIPRTSGEILELYDLTADPGETKNLVDDPALAEVRARLLREVKGFADYGTGSPAGRLPGGTPPPGARPGSPGPEPDGLSPEERERLRSLGYIN